MTSEERIKALARESGFALVGVAPATPADGFDRLREWLARGYAGERTMTINGTINNPPPRPSIPPARPATPPTAVSPASGNG